MGDRHLGIDPATKLPDFTGRPRYLLDDQRLDDAGNQTLAEAQQALTRLQRSLTAALFLHERLTKSRIGTIVLGFLGVLTVGFVYEWCKGALEWE